MSVPSASTSALESKTPSVSELKCDTDDERRQWFTKLAGAIKEIKDKFDGPHKSFDMVVGGSFALRVLCDHLITKAELKPMGWMPGDVDVFFLGGISENSFRKYLWPVMMRTFETKRANSFRNPETWTMVLGRTISKPFVVELIRTDCSTWEEISIYVDLMLTNVFLVNSETKPDKAVCEYIPGWWIVTPNEQVIDDIKNKIVRIDRDKKCKLYPLTEKRSEKYVERGFTNVIYDPHEHEVSIFDKYLLDIMLLGEYRPKTETSKTKTSKK